MNLVGGVFCHFENISQICNFANVMEKWRIKFNLNNINITVNPHVQTIFRCQIQGRTWSSAVPVGHLPCDPRGVRGAGELLEAWRLEETLASDNSNIWLLIYKLYMLKKNWDNWRTFTKGFVGTNWFFFWPSDRCAELGRPTIRVSGLHSNASGVGAVVLAYRDWKSAGYLTATDRNMIGINSYNSTFYVLANLYQEQPKYLENIFNWNTECRAYLEKNSWQR